MDSNSVSQAVATPAEEDAYEVDSEAEEACAHTVHEDTDRDDIQEAAVRESEGQAASVWGTKDVIESRGET